MEFITALYVLSLILAIVGAIPPLRGYYLLHIAVVLIALGLVFTSGAVKLP